MKQFLITVILSAAGIVYGQSFEGTLTYVTDFELSEKFKKMGVTKQMLIDKMKKDGSGYDTITISYQQGNYAMVINMRPKSRAIYTSATNKIYTTKDGEDICTVTDASVDLEFTMTGKMPTVVKLDSTAIINGTTCKIVRVKWESGTYDYYYHTGMMTVVPALYSKHTFDGWAEFLKISNALPVKVVKMAKGLMTVTMTLVSSKNEKINDKLFSIPTLVPDKDLNLIKLGNSEIMRIKK